MSGAIVPPKDSRWLFLIVGVAAGLVLGIVIGANVLPATTSSPGKSTASLPLGSPPVSNCFGGGNCSASVFTTNGSGIACVVAGFEETAGEFLYVAINYMAGTDQIISVTDGGADSFNYVGGEFANNQSVAYYDVPADHGGAVTITVTLRTTEFGACTVGELTAGTTVGAVGPGGSVGSGYGVSVGIDVQHEPSLLMALFGSTRPTGNPTVTASNNGTVWTLADEWTGYTYNGAAQVLSAENDYTAGAVVFTWQVGNSQTPSVSGIVVELDLGT